LLSFEPVFQLQLFEVFEICHISGHQDQAIDGGNCG